MSGFFKMACRKLVEMKVLMWSSNVYIILWIKLRFKKKRDKITIQRNKA